MLAAVAARLPKQTDNVWVDLGGGTGVRYFYLHVPDLSVVFLLPWALAVSGCRRTC